LFACGSAVIRASVANLRAWLIVIVPALAAEKPAESPDQPLAFATPSRFSVVEFNLSTLAAEIQRDIPRQLATIDERVTCVHRRVLLVKINANGDIRGYVERTSPVVLYGKGECPARWLSSARSPVKVPTGSRLASGAKRRRVRRSRRKHGRSCDVS
jgi:hypothetical protein